MKFELKKTLVWVSDDKIPDECLGYYANEINPEYVLEDKETIDKVNEALHIFHLYQNFLSEHNLFL